jgi:hypothetical protein
MNDLGEVLKCKIDKIWIDSVQSPINIFGYYNVVDIVSVDNTSKVNIEFRSTQSFNMNLLDDISPEVIATNITYSHAITTTYNVTFIVRDLEKFSEDIKDYHWRKFDREFIEQLDAVLVEE